MGQRHVWITMICLGIGLLLTACPGGQNRGNWFTGESPSIEQIQGEIQDGIVEFSGEGTPVGEAEAAAEGEGSGPAEETSGGVTDDLSESQDDTLRRRGRALSVTRSLRDGTYETAELISFPDSSGSVITYGSIAEGVNVTTVQATDDSRTTEATFDDGTQVFLFQGSFGDTLVNIKTDGIRITKTESDRDESVVFTDFSRVASGLVNTLTATRSTSDDGAFILSKGVMVNVSATALEIVDEYRLDSLSDVRKKDAVTVRSDSGKTRDLSADERNEIKVLSDDELMVLKVLGVKKSTPMLKSNQNRSESESSENRATAGSANEASGGQQLTAPVQETLSPGTVQTLSQGVQAQTGRGK